MHETMSTTTEETYGTLRIERIDGERRPLVKVYQGKQRRPDYIQFQSVERREEYIVQRNAGADYAEQAKQERAVARASLDATTLYQPGDIVVSTWGYDQTNVEFYRVERVTKASVTLIEIGQRTTETTGSMSEMVAANPDWTGKMSSHRVQPGGSMKIGHGYGSLWHGRPMHQSSYA